MMTLIILITAIEGLLGCIDFYFYSTVSQSKLMNIFHKYPITPPSAICSSFMTNFLSLCGNDLSTHAKNFVKLCGMASKLKVKVKPCFLSLGNIRNQRSYTHTHTLARTDWSWTRVEPRLRKPKTDV